MNRQETYAQRASAQTGWTGWIVFASLMMGLAGIFQIISGLAALFKDTVFLVGEDKLVFMSFDQWGWTYLILGTILFFSAFSLASGHLWGRAMGVLLATLSAIANFVFIQAYPLWSILIIMVDVFVIYSIIMHGRELSEE